MAICDAVLIMITDTNRFILCICIWQNGKQSPHIIFYVFSPSLTCSSDGREVESVLERTKGTARENVLRARKRQFPFLRKRLRVYSVLDIKERNTRCLTSSSYQLFAHLYCKYCHNLYHFLLASEDIRHPFFHWR